MEKAGEEGWHTTVHSSNIWLGSSGLGVSHMIENPKWLKLGLRPTRALKLFEKKRVTI